MSVNWMGQLSTLQQLQRLHLGMQLHELNGNVMLLTGLNALTSLHLTQCYCISDQSVEAFCAGVLQLQELQVSSPRMRSAVDVFPAIAQLRGLVWLSIEPGSDLNVLGEHLGLLSPLTNLTCPV